MSFIAVVILSGCDGPAQKSDTTKEKLAQSWEDAKVEVAKFKEDSKLRIDANEIAIANFEARMAASKNEIKASCDKQRAMLK